MSSKRSVAERRLVADVAGRVADADVDGGDRRPGESGERVDRRSALPVRRQHRLGHPGRVRRHLGCRGDTVVGGEDQRRPAWRLAGATCAATRRPRRRSRRARRAHRSAAGCRRRVRGRRHERPGRTPGDRRGVRAAASCVEPVRIGSRSSSARPATRNRLRVDSATQAWLTRPRTSRYRRPRSVSGCTPRPTSLVTTTTGADRAAAWRAASGALGPGSRCRCAPPTSCCEVHRVRQSTIASDVVGGVQGGDEVGALLDGGPLGGRSAMCRSMRSAMSSSTAGRSRCRVRWRCS